MIQATPTAINYQFPDDNNAVVLKRLKPASINLSLLANTIIQISQPSSEPVHEPPAYSNWIIALANMGIPAAYLMLVGSRVLVSAGQSVFEQSILPIPSIGLSALFMFSAIVAGQITAYSIYSPQIER
ncbi:hypothetical protein AK966_13890 [Vibrio sp. PID23_8]|nr:hypothetical protein AK966_13890 [Vibrio sp. PID23_8]